MSFFRRPFERRDLLVRPAAAHDQTAVALLAQRAPRRYLTTDSDDVVELLHSEPTVVLEHAGRVVGLAQAGWRLPPNAWLRSILLDSRLDARTALPLLLRQLHGLLPTRGISALYITLSPWSDPWLRAGLELAGYAPIMEVWGYSKERMEVPASGNPFVVVRRARPEDLTAVLQLDARCFPPPWGKGREILAPALCYGPYFSVAEWQQQIVGYSYVSLHEAGLRAHLVRIAVDPAFQGRGIGVRLLAEVVRFCRSRQVEVLSLNTQHHNTGAQRLYEWFGFRRTGEVQVVLGITGLDGARAVAPPDERASRPEAA